MDTKRRQKIYYSVDRAEGWGGHYFTGSKKPLLKISNRFLLRAGFEVGSEVEIHYSHEILTVRKLKQTNL